jgi:hypothetical protein
MFNNLTPAEYEVLLRHCALCVPGCVLAAKG